MAHIQDTELILRYHQFSTEDLREITKALRVSVLTRCVSLIDSFSILE